MILRLDNIDGKKYKNEQTGMEARKHALSAAGCIGECPGKKRGR